MVLSNETIEVLKNFATINANIACTTDKVLKTVGVSKNIMAKSPILEEFPYDFGIYDLPEFLSAVGMFEDPELAFDENKKFVAISNGTSSIKYFFSQIGNLVVAKNEPKMPDSAVKFNITHEQLMTIRKASSALNVPSMVVTPNGSSEVDLTVTDTSNNTSNEFKLSVRSNGSIESEFSFVFNINNFKFSNSDAYAFDVSSKSIASVTAGDTLYWLALDNKQEKTK